MSNNEFNLVSNEPEIRTLSLDSAAVNGAVNYRNARTLELGDHGVLFIDDIARHSDNGGHVVRGELYHDEKYEQVAVQLFKRGIVGKLIHGKVHGYIES